MTGELTVFRGDYAAYHRQRVERDARAVKDARRRRPAIAREQELVQRYRSHRKFSKMHEHEARLDRLQGEQVEAPRRARKAPPADGAHRPGTGRRARARSSSALEDLVVGYLPDRDGGRRRSVATEPKRVARVPWLTASAGRADRDRRPERGRQDDAPPDDRRRPAAARRPARRSAAPSRSATSPSSATPPSPARRSSTRCLAAMPVTAGEARSYLARFLFRGDDAFKEVRLLSGGERSRLELALLGITPVQPAAPRRADEPPRHPGPRGDRGVPGRDAGDGRSSCRHDRRLLETVCDRLWVVDDGLAVPFDGGYRAWRAAVSDGWSPDAASRVGGPTAPRPPESRRRRRP